MNDGVSLLNIADSALGELSSVVTRLRDLSQQAANGTYTAKQRAPLQQEAQALQEEYNRILNSTQFNNGLILTGATSKFALQGGYGEESILDLQVGKKMLSDAFGIVAAGEIIRVSTSSSGAQSTGTAQLSSLSADNRFVVFQSNASDLIAGVSGSQIYVRDLMTNQLMVASSNGAGTSANGTATGEAQISANGRFVVFSSDATNLVAGVSGTQIYRKDLISGDVQLVSASASGVASSGGTNFNASFSADGKYVAFASTATFLVAGVSQAQVYVKNIETGQIEIASQNEAGVVADLANIASSLRISADGRKVAFRSHANTLVSGASDSHIYHKDLDTGALQIMGRDVNGTIVNGNYNFATLSADGRYVTFQTSVLAYRGYAGNQIFVHDTVTGAVDIVSADENGVAGTGGAAYRPSISADGRFVAFVSNQTGLVDGVSGAQVYVKDRSTGKITIASRSTEGSASGGGATNRPFISYDGTKVAFQSDSATLVSGDTNGSVDVFLRDLSTAGVQELSGVVVSDAVSAREITIGLLERRLEELGTIRGQIGSSASRVGTFLENVGSKNTILEESHSRIMDADKAQEASRMVSTQIRQRVAASVLANAYAQPQLALILLRDN